QQSALAAREREVATAEARLAGLAADAAERSAAEAEVKRCRRARDELLRQVPADMVMKERAEPRPAHVFLRGAYDHLGAPVERATPAFLPPLPGRSGDGPPTRLDLAHWLVSPTNPLTARVEVNRIWHQLFGVGLVETAEDLGTQGERPSHPELLDHLAITFVESGWDVKALVRRIVTTETYRQDSRAAPAEFERDPDNRLLARGSRFRMDAEMIRDQILASSGLLNPEHYGRSVKPPQPDGIWRAVTLPDSLPRTFTPDRGDAIYRRSVYTFWKRGMPPPQLTILNAPTREFCTARRERTNTPLQALLLLNEREYLGAARHLAAATLRQEPSDAERLDVLYETITSQLPDARERAILTATLDDLRTAYAHDPALAAALADDDDAVDAAPAELAAWTMVASAIYNLDITRTRQ
ncbi:MAG: DUF1553 domain-containing protein, partial [Planctomycetes bacterium]|nr:DUF1553 domain-containing protein [Planctomycetota bacterium]